MDDAPISAEDKHKIFHRNAERIFGIPAAPGGPACSGAEQSSRMP